MKLFVFNSAKRDIAGKKGFPKSFVELYFVIVSRSDHEVVDFSLFRSARSISIIFRSLRIVVFLGMFHQPRGNAGKNCFTVSAFCFIVIKFLILCLDGVRFSSSRRRHTLFCHLGPFSASPTCKFFRDKSLRGLGI